MSVNNGNSIYNEGGMTSAEVKNIVDNLPEFQAKADKVNTLSNYDVYVSRSGQIGQGWYKIAQSKANISVLTNTSLNFEFFASTNDYDNHFCGNLVISLRARGSGTSLEVNKFVLYTDQWSTNFLFKVVTRGVSGNWTFELWAAIKPQITDASVLGGLSLAEINESNYRTVQQKQYYWSFTSYNSVAGVDAPVDDPDNNVKVTDVTIETRVHKKDIDNLMTDGTSGQITETPPQQVYVTGKFYFVNGKVCRCTAYSASSATFDVYGVVEAMNYILSQV